MRIMTALLLLLVGGSEMRLMVYVYRCIHVHPVHPPIMDKDEDEDDDDDDS